MGTGTQLQRKLLDYTEKQVDVINYGELLRITAAATEAR